MGRQKTLNKVNYNELILRR